MFDVWIGDVELTRLVLVFSIAVLLPLQLLLCFKVRRLFIRLLPVLVLSIPAILFVGMLVASSGWVRLGYLFLTMFAGFMLLMCGIGWSIWAIARLAAGKKGGSSPPA